MDQNHHTPRHDLHLSFSQGAARMKTLHLIDLSSLGGELPGFRRANCNARVLPGFRDVSLLQAEAASDISLHPLRH